MSEKLRSSIETTHSPEQQTERRLETLDLTHEMERILFTILESGPELDPAYLASLRDYLRYLMGQLSTPYNDNDNPDQFLDNIKSSMGIHPDNVKSIMEKHALPDTLRQVVEKIIAGRHEGLSDKTIYHRLARVYHPDQTSLSPDEAEEIFKLIGQLLYDENTGFCF